MRFDEWTAEAHRSLEAWDPEPAASPVALLARPGSDDTTAASTATTSEGHEVEVIALDRREPGSPRRRLLAVAAAAAVVAAGIAAVVAFPSADAEVAIDPQAAPPRSAVEPVEPAPSAGPSFECAAADAERGGSTSVFESSVEVAEWRAIDVDDPEAGAPPAGPVGSVQGTLIAPEGEALTETMARGATFVGSAAPDWACTVWSPTVDVADPSRPGPIVDDTGVVTNRLGGMCFVPDATASPDAVWGVDADVAAALDRVDGLTDWRVILADGGGNGQGPGRLWMELSVEADATVPDAGAASRVLDQVDAAVAAAGAAAGVTTECVLH